MYINLNSDLVCVLLTVGGLASLVSGLVLLYFLTDSDIKRLRSARGDQIQVAFDFRPKPFTVKPGEAFQINGVTYLPGATVALESGKGLAEAKTFGLLYWFDFVDAYYNSSRAVWRKCQASIAFADGVQCRYISRTKVEVLGTCRHDAKTSAKLPRSEEVLDALVSEINQLARSYTFGLEFRLEDELSGGTFYAGDFELRIVHCTLSDFH